MATETTPSTVEIAAESLATMERETQALFDVANQSRIAGANQTASGRKATPSAAESAKDASNTVSNANGGQASRSNGAAPATASPATSTTATPTSKVSGPPTTSTPTIERTVATEAKPTVAASNEFADVPAVDAWDKKQVKSNDWKRLHEKASSFETRAAAAERELAELRARVATAAPSSDSALQQQQLTAISAERDALQARLEAVAVEKSPRFEAAFKPREDAARMQAKAAVGPENAARIEALMAMPESAWRDEQLETIISGMPTLRATKLTQAIADIDRLTAERQQMSQRGNELWKTWTAEEQQNRNQQQAQRTAQANAVFESELKTWQSAITLDDASIATARSVYSGQGVDLKDAANAAMWAVVGPRIAQDASQAKVRISELETQLSKLKGAQPSHAADTSSTGATSDDTDDPATMSYMDRIVREGIRAGVLKQ